MLPSVFISSTIADLHYLRDGIRDAIEDLAYQPVMSEYGEIGYLNPVTAAESCYRSVKQCQMVILIVGRRYGKVGPDGLSVTHREYQTAKAEGLPTITFVEPDVLSFKEVYDAAPTAKFWESFERMDNPNKTFQLLNEISGSETFNAILPFSSVSDAKRRLKRQIAEFVGDRLVDVVSPINQQVRDILAEVRTMRNMVVHSGNGASEMQTRRYLAITRYLLNDNCKDYREFLVRIYKDLDAATERIDSCESFLDVVTAAGWTLELVDKWEFSGPMFSMHPIAVNETDQSDKNTELPKARMVSGSFFGHEEGYEIFSDKRIRIASRTASRFDHLQKTIRTKANMT